MPEDSFDLSNWIKKQPAVPPARIDSLDEISPGNVAHELILGWGEMLQVDEAKRAQVAKRVRSYLKENFRRRADLLPPVEARVRLAFATFCLVQFFPEQIYYIEMGLAATSLISSAALLGKLEPILRRGVKIKISNAK